MAQPLPVLGRIAEAMYDPEDDFFRDDGGGSVLTTTDLESDCAGP
jgi:hypothetical protein